MKALVLEPIAKSEDTGVVRWAVEIFNQTDVNLTFSNKVYDGEMCNVFGFYTMETNTGGPWLCAFF